ncbi:MAG TPA: response regulator transcription factor [Burkholderiales bacterium]|nr:response regulator transcription factor [Burkholderiales bacterium]
MDNGCSAYIEAFDAESVDPGSATPAAPVTVFIVEDSPMMRERFAEMIRGAANAAVVGEADTAGDAVEGILRTRPDWVLLDLQLIRGTGLDVLRAVRAAVSDTGFIVTTNFNTPQYRRACIDAGASHFLDKTRASSIRDIVAGPRYSAGSTGGGT